jgi:hypothetical protein
MLISVDDSAGDVVNPRNWKPQRGARRISPTGIAPPVAQIIDEEQPRPLRERRRGDIALGIRSGQPLGETDTDLYWVTPARAVPERCSTVRCFQLNRRKRVLPQRFHAITRAQLLAR